MKYTNNHNLSLLLAGWLIDDEYTNGKDLYPDKELISATSLLKPVRETVLQKQLDLSTLSIDVSDKVSSRIGQAIHDSIEKTWKHKYKYVLKKLEYQPSIYENIIINPTEPVQENQIPIYLEQRYFKELDDVIISGQVDQIFDGTLSDVKTTSVWSYLSGNNDEKFKQQLSFYRWLNPEIITNDVAYINYVFTGWESYKAEIDPKYPQARAIAVTVVLYSIEEIELILKQKLKTIKEESLKSQIDMIQCTDKELWRDPPKYKYYSDPTKMIKSTKNFDSLKEANEHLLTKGKGVIKIVEGTPKACKYCSVATICEQRKELFNDDGF
jgi:hypothetical protein